MPHALESQERGAAALVNALSMLRPDLPRVLYIAAHPDDEDTRLITWLQRGGYADVAYLSLNRGEGGQNLIGEELGDALGVVRTQELLAARRIDGARQYFTRAYDFGYSKTADESYMHWPHDSLLGDVVRIIRAVRPHILVSTFSGTPLDAHGQHQVAGLLTGEGYEAAGDTVRFPVRAYGPAWQSLKLYRLARFSSGTATIAVNVGEYDPLAGRSYVEIASDSRSRHKSQGYRANARLGTVWDSLRREATRANPGTAAEAERSLFDGIPGAVDAPSNLPHGVDVSRPALAIPIIARFSPTTERERALYDRAAALAAGVVLEALAARSYVAASDTVSVTYTLYNRGDVPVRIDSAAVGFSPGWIAPGGAARWVSVLRAAELTQPWWLRHPRAGDMYDVPITAISDDERDRESWVRVLVTVAELPRPARLAAPIMYRLSEGVYGDLFNPLLVAPGLTVTPVRERWYARAGNPFARDVAVAVRSSFPDSREVAVRLVVPAGFRSVPSEQRVIVAGGGTGSVTFRLEGTPSAGELPIGIEAVSGGTTFAQQVQEINYDHIVPQRLYRPARLRITAVELIVPASITVGYVEGMADPGDETLTELGIPVTLIAPAELAQTDLSRFTTIVVGPRAYEAHPELLEHNQRLFDYVAAGGRLVVQFGQYVMDRPGILPYRIAISRPPDRVTDERAPVTFIDPAAPELTFPNRIVPADFDGWIQERATFMPGEFDARYRTVLAMNDPGEPPKRSSILVAPVGRGTYVYTTLALFRQFTDGVAGAARLFVNLVTPPSQ